MDDLKLYCRTCNTDLTMHADGTITCECNDLWRKGSSAVPADWVDNLGDPVEPATLENWIEFEELGQ